MQPFYKDIIAAKPFAKGVTSAGNVSVVGYNKPRRLPGQVDSFNMLPARAEVVTNNIVYLLFIYDKSEKENLTNKELDEWLKYIPE